jgi:tight adherence protein C
VTLALLAGAGVGLGLLAILRGITPPRAPLAAALARLQPGATPPGRPPPPPPAPAGAPGWGVRLLGAPLERLAGPLGLVPHRLARDLAVLARPPERHLADKATLALVGLLLAPATTAALAVAGVRVPLAVPVWAAVLLGAAGFVTPDLGVRADAAARRRDLRHALSSLLDLTVIALAGGAGVEGALTDAASIGRGPAAARLRQALAGAQLRREPPWAPLGRLGEELGVEELVELAASMRLAGAEGARVRASLAAKAASVRAHLRAEAETTAQAATEQMSLPVVLLFAGFLVFVGYPALARVLTGL